MMAILMWLISVAVSLLLLYLIVKAAINNSVMADLYRENRLLVDAHNKNANALADLSRELKEIRRLMEEQPK